MNYLKISKQIYAAYTKQQIIDYVKFKILTDEKWQKKALKKLVEEEYLQQLRVYNNQDRLKNIGFDRQHKDDFMDAYYGKKPLDNRLINKLSTFSKQLVNKHLKPNGMKVLYQSMNNNDEYLIRNHLKPQSNKQLEIESQDKEKEIELKRMLDIIEDSKNRISNNEHAYGQIVSIINKIYKQCDLLILMRILPPQTYRNLIDIIDILINNNWNYLSPQVKERIEINPNASDNLPMFWTFNIYNFTKIAQDLLKNL